MTRTQLETLMGRMPKIDAVNSERLTEMIMNAACGGTTSKTVTNLLLEAVLTAAKSRNMSLHALRDKSLWKPRERFGDNIYELLRVATGPKAVNAKIIICIGMVNDLVERRDS